MLEIKSKEDKLKLLRDLNSGNPDFKAFMWGLDDDVEKSIIKFINSSGGIVTVSELINNIVYNNAWCSKNRLINRLESLVSHQYLWKVAKKISYNSYSKDVVCYVLRIE
jgi:hypothetical protein